MREEYTVTVGLEIHAELTTKTKMFCNSKNDADEKTPNVNICPVCMGHPGTLPVINKEAVKQVLRVGVAVGGTLADFTEFDRKNYFYPDIPKAYQISQFKYPLISGGNIAGFDLTRIHLEEDTARSSHGKGGKSLVDYNRAGLPLMELVTEPVIHSAKDAVRFAKEFQQLLQYIGASHANLEKGEMRVEANISVSKTEELGTKVEVKNLNSFKVVEKAIEYEVDRHIKILESGEGEIVQETRGWNEDTQSTFSQRAKENSKDYRYFPDPDLPKLKISELPEFEESKLRESLPELPWARRGRYEASKWGLSEGDIEILVARENVSIFFDEAVNSIKDEKAGKLVANMIISELSVLAAGVDVLSDKYFGKITPKEIAEIAGMKIAGDISSRGVKDILKIIFAEGGSAKEVADKNGLIQKSDPEELKKIVAGIITENPAVVEEYKSGKESVVQFLVGQGMKATKGSANPGMLKQLFEEGMK
jgi:aspartyl-tRNA(Asn)/glutamyl-tRNA(Gln) amidotransferase subunit B